MRAVRETMEGMSPEEIIGRLSKAGIHVEAGVLVVSPKELLLAYLDLLERLHRLESAARVKAPS